MTTPNLESTNEKCASIKCDTIDDLPIEIIQKILFELSPKDLRSAKSCCKRWRAALSGDFLWKKLCQRECYVEKKNWSRNEFYTDYLQRYKNYWEGVYWYNHTVQHNWETNSCHRFSYQIKEPHYDYTNCTFLDDLFIIMNLSRTKMYVYNLKAEKLATCWIDAHIVDIEFYSKSLHYLIKFVPNQELTVWNLRIGWIVIHNFFSDVASIYPYHDLILLHTPNEKLEVLNIETKKIEYERRGVFNNVAIKDGRILFTMDNVIHILKWDNKSLITLTCCNENEYHALLVVSNLLLSFCKKDNSLDKTLCLWNIATKTKVHSISLGNADNIRKFMLINKYLYVAKIISNDNHKSVDLIDMWDYKKGTLVLTIPISAPNFIVNEHFIIASVSCRIVMFCFRTRDLTYYSNLPFNHYQLSNVLMTDSKIAYVKRRTDNVLLLVQDYET